jgi:hypothetical protein
MSPELIFVGVSIIALTFGLQRVNLVDEVCFSLYMFFSLEFLFQTCVLKKTNVTSSLLKLSKPREREGGSKGGERKQKKIVAKEVRRI